MGFKVHKTGDIDLDENYVIKSNNENGITRMLANLKIKSHLLEMVDFEIGIRHDMGPWGEHFNENEDELYFTTRGFIMMESPLRDILDLYCIMLDEMDRLGLISDEEPEVRLFAK